MGERATSSDPPESIENEEQLEELLSRPTKDVVELIGHLEGGLAIIGGGGKIGPSLTRMACRARQEAARGPDICVIDRFPDPAVREALAVAGAETITCDLLDASAVAGLPAAENVIYMVGLKFGTADQPALTWAANTLIPAYVAEHYRNARIVAFSTGCVYSFVPADSAGSVETDPLEPIGEYSNACVARERVLEFFCTRNGTPLVQLRLNYAVEMRYGVLVDLALAVLAGEPIDARMGCFNVIWQGDVNAAALRLLAHAGCPPLAINLTGAEKLSVRDLAGRLGELTGRQVRFAGVEADTALLSDASRAHRLLGPPAVPIERVLRWTARWVAAGRKTLGKPTHFQSRDGRY